MNCNIINDHKDISFTFDWINCIIPVTDVTEFLFGLSDLDDKFSLSNFFLANTGLYNYRCKVCLSNMPSITFAWNPDYNSKSIINFDKTAKIDNSTGELFIDRVGIPSTVLSGLNDGLFISISGNGLRYLGNDLTISLFKYLHSFNARISRIDIACDIKDPDNYIIPMLDTAFKTFYYDLPDAESTIHFNRFQPTAFTPESCQYIENKDFSTGSISHNIVVGTHSSKFGMLRIYDKYLEVKYSNRSDKSILDDISYWYRIECELHHNHATNLFNSVVADSTPISCAFSSAFGQMFRVCEVKSEGYQINQCPSTDEYLKFVNWLKQNVHFVQFVTEPFVQNNIEHFQKYMLHNSSYLYNAFLLLDHVPGLKEAIWDKALKKRLTTNQYSYIDDFCDKLTNLLTAES